MPNLLSAIGRFLTELRRRKVYQVALAHIVVGFMVIEAEDGTTYEPKELPVDFEKDGLQVRVWADRLEGQASIRMVGPIISIVRIERRDTGGYDREEGSP